METRSPPLLKLIKCQAFHTMFVLLKCLLHCLIKWEENRSRRTKTMPADSYSRLEATQPWILAVLWCVYCHLIWNIHCYKVLFNDSHPFINGSPGRSQSESFAQSAASLVYIEPPDSLTANQRATVLPLQKNTAVLLSYEKNNFLWRKMHFAPRDCKVYLLMSTKQRQNWKTPWILHSDVLMWKGSEMKNSTSPW